jgi:hypothetical protein
MAARSINTPTLVAALVVLLLLLGGLGWHYFGPNTAGGRARPLTAQERTDQDWLNQKAKESGGDFNKLSPEDQRKMFASHGPRAPFNLRQAAQSLANSK